MRALSVAGGALLGLWGAPRIWHTGVPHWDGAAVLVGGLWFLAARAALALGRGAR